MEKHEYRIVYIALGIAGICIIGGLMLAAFLAGLLVARPLAATNAPDMATLKKILASKQGIGFNSPPNTIVIIPGKGGAQFTQPGTKLPAGNTVTWVNKTGQPQTLITDSNSKNINIAPGETANMSFPEGGRSYTWHLESNPQASTTVYVGARG